MLASIMRFIPMAPVLAPTMATHIQKTCPKVGALSLASEASTTPIKANGKAKTVCENLIISSRVVNFTQALFVIVVSISDLKNLVYNALSTGSSKADSETEKVCFAFIREIQDRGMT